MKHRRLRIIGYVLIALIALLGVARLFLPWFVQNYVNRTLDRNPLYAGTIGRVQIHLCAAPIPFTTSASTKRTGDVPVPFFSAKRVDFAIQWNALDAPQNCRARADAATGNQFCRRSHRRGIRKAAPAAPWLQMIRDLSPFKINSAEIQDGSVHFRAYQYTEALDVYLSHVNGSIQNLSNIHDEPLRSSPPCRHPAWRWTRQNWISK